MNRIRELRKERNWNQEDLGNKLGVQKAAISKYETGSNSLSDDIAIRLATIFNVSVDYLLGLSGEKRNPSEHTESDNFPSLNGEPTNHIYHLIGKAGLGYDEVAGMLGISEDLLENYCSGKDMPLSILVELSKICSVSTDCLLGLRESSRPEQDGVMPFQFDPEISRRLKDQAKQMNESYGFITDVLGIEESEVFNFFEYGFVPHLEVFVKIVEHFVVSSDYLLNRTNSILTVQASEEKILRLYRSLNTEYQDIANGELTKLRKQQEHEEYMKASSVAAEDRLRTGTDHLGKL